MATEPEALQIVRLGAQGDGIADDAGQPRYVPFALPGETVRPAGEGLPELVSAPSPDRKAPICRHFSVCGGCVAQHMQDGLCADWKRGIVVEAFRQRGLDAGIAPMLSVPPASRRRAVLTARIGPGATILGYHRRHRHDVFDVRECPVLVPAIVERLDALRAIAATVARDEARLTVLATPAGLDVAVEGGGRIDARQGARLAEIAAASRLARISIAGQPIVQRAAPALAFGDVAATPPPGTFVQAVAEAEAAIAREVTTAVGKAKRVADLFCGIGTLTFHLARSAAVTAIDSDKAALEALRTAARHAKGRKPIEAKVRDLFREPLSPRELEGIGAVVFDPPRAGAKAQAEQLARASVPVVVAVSCNPGTLARDARILVDGGYRLERVVPIDQFLYSAHVEAVAVLRR